MRVTIPVSVGICAFNERDRIGDLLESVLRQTLPRPFTMQEVLVVASGCTDGTEEIVRRRAASDDRVELIVQQQRRGKASALNEILHRYTGSVLVLANADSRLGVGALRALLTVFFDDPDTEVACGAPAPDGGGQGILRLAEAFEWEIHNDSLDLLSAENGKNHCCDELMAIRRGFVERLPQDLINDGAYIGALAGLRGRTVRFVPEARVYVRTPRDFPSLVRRRQRILRGHRQVQSLLHRLPNTFEELVKRNPRLAAAVMIRQVRRRPLSVVLLPLLAMPLEAVSLALAIVDGRRHPAYQPAWPKVA